MGSGSTIVYAVERLAELEKYKNFKLTCVPTSFQAEQVRMCVGLCKAIQR